MNAYQFLSALRARAGIFAFLLLTTVLVATAASLLMPRIYTATVSLLLDAQEQQSLSTALRPLVSSQERASYLQTQLDIITSEKVARKVVVDLKLAQRPLSANTMEDVATHGGSVEDELVEILLKELKVDTSQSSVIPAQFFIP